MPPRFPIAEVPYVLIDLDDTLAEYNGYRGWKHIGPPREYARTFVRKFKEHGWKTILWSTRAEVGHLVEWLERHGFVDDEVGEGLAGDEDGRLLFDYIGQSPLNALLGSNPAKPVADLIVDNACYPFCGEPVPLAAVMSDLCQRGIMDWRQAVGSVEVAEYGGQTAAD
jgi:hypothetical protein